MSRKKALLASSLTVCSASNPLAANSHDSSVAYAETHLQQSKSQPGSKIEYHQSSQQYLKPVSMNMTTPTTQQDSKIITYKVKKGDTLYQIGLSFGIHHRDLQEYNQIADPRELQIGQELIIPFQTEEVYVRKRMTAEEVAKAYDTTPALVRYLNPFFQEQTVTDYGQWIVVPKKMEMDYRKPLPQTQTVTIPPKYKKKKHKKKVVIMPSLQSDAKPEITSNYFNWPVKGQITSKFGWRRGRQHKGIDIWNVAKANALIYAARGGVVTRAGYTNGYGNLVVIEHGNGWVTYYAHLSRIHVGKGQRIETGDVVGNMGQTGNATGYHLHFEIRKNGEAINPLSLLP